MWSFLFGKDEKAAAPDAGEKTEEVLPTRKSSTRKSWVIITEPEAEPCKLAEPEAEPSRRSTPPSEPLQQVQEEEAKPVVATVGAEEGDTGEGALLDLVFMCDSTASMGSYISAAQQNICSIVERVVQSEKADVRFALIAYRDHPPQDNTFITNIFPFTRDVDEMKANVDTMSAEGGGDGPEAVTAALHDTLHLPWREGATKIAVLIADAPPHGIEPHGDGFPDGDPLGRDPLEIARQMRDNAITCYAVGCEPALGQYYFARDFMCSLAEITGGQAIALSSASLLADVIVNGSAEEITLTQLQRQVEQEMEQVQREAEEANEDVGEEILLQRCSTRLQSKNVRTKQMRTDGLMKISKKETWDRVSTLSDAKAELCKEVDLNSVGSSCGRSRRSSSKAFGLGSFFASRESSKKSKKRSMGSVCLDFPEIESSEAMCREEAMSAPAPYIAPVAATMNVCEEDVISASQVTRMWKRKSTRA